MLNATWLETFTTLCEVGHFTRTADKLGMTQPGVSQHLRKLEAQVGKPLITQDGKSFDVTAAGEAVLEVGKARRRQESALQDSLNGDNRDIGTVSVGCSGSFAMWIYPHLLNKLHSAPDLVVRVTAAPQSSIIEAVLAGDLDLGVVVESPLHPRLTATPLAREELSLVLPTNSTSDDITLPDLNALGFVAHPDGFAYADELLSMNFPEDYKGSDQLRVRTFVNQIGQIPIPVAQGLGYTILPKSGIEAFPDKQNLKVVALPKQRFHDLWMISRPGRSKIARVASIGMLMQRVAKSLDH